MAIAQRPDRHHKAVSVALLSLVTDATRASVIDREPKVMKQQPTKLRGGLGGHRVGKVRKVGRQFERVRCLCPTLRCLPVLTRDTRTGRRPSVMSTARRPRVIP